MPDPRTIIERALAQFDTPYWKPNGDWAEMGECREEIRRAIEATKRMHVTLERIAAMDVRSLNASVLARNEARECLDLISGD